MEEMKNEWTECPEKESDNNTPAFGGTVCHNTTAAE
jgi:hypothetical protein